MNEEFRAKQAARQHAWDILEREGLSRPPFPVHGRIPNFVGAELAAQRLFAEPVWAEAKAIKVNPDTAQQAVRLEALRRGICLYVPTPRLTGGFMRLDPNLIAPACFPQAAARQTMSRWAQPVALRDMPQLDAMVSGCAAVTPQGKRCGKGAGYSDIEFAMLLELGLEARPVATTVHDVQVVGDFPVDSNDLPLSVICTPTRTIRVASPHSAPTGIQWQRLSQRDLEAMPVLRELQLLRQASLE